MHKHGISAGLIQDHTGKWCKDFYKVAIDFERKTEWSQTLGEIKRYLERSEKEILLEYHLGQLKGKDHEGDQKRIIGKWSFVSPLPAQRLGSVTDQSGVRRQRA